MVWVAILSFELGELEASLKRELRVFFSLCNLSRGLVLSAALCVFLSARLGSGLGRGLRVELQADLSGDPVVLS